MPHADDPIDDTDLAAPIPSARLRLVVIPAEMLRAIAAGSTADVDWPGVGSITAELSSTLPASMRLRQADADPEVAAWLIRGIVVDDPAVATGCRVIGHLGGHDRPSEEGMVEAGYTVAAAERGRGIATEACAAWFGWAHHHGAAMAQLSIDPTNAASLAVARRLGMTEVDRVWDEDDQVWELVLRAPLPLD